MSRSRTPRHGADGPAGLEGPGRADGSDAPAEPHEPRKPAGARKPAGPVRPDRVALRAAHGRTIPDVLPGSPSRAASSAGLVVLFCGINPSLYSAATGYHFARPGNRFWPALHGSGFTDRRLAPYEQHLMPGYGLGITNLVARATARADELTEDELRCGGLRLSALVERYAPRYVAVAGVTAYRTAFGDRTTAIGPQPGAGIAGAGLWVLPNPSGLNAGWPLDRIVAEFGRLRRAAGLGDPR